MPPSEATSQYPSFDAVGAIPTTGLTKGKLPADPKKPAFPKLKMPPSEATIQYDEFGGAGGGGDGGPGIPAEPEKAETWSVLGASSRPSPTDGVGKWLAWPPIETCWTVCPLAGSSP